MARSTSACRISLYGVVLAISLASASAISLSSHASNISRDAASALLHDPRSIQLVITVTYQRFKRGDALIDPEQNRSRPPVDSDVPFLAFIAFGNLGVNLFDPFRRLPAHGFCLFTILLI